MHCKAVADAYVKENTDLNEDGVTGRSVTLDKVDYSPARNSCVAQVETTTYFKGGALEIESLRDLLSGETLFSVNSTDEEFDAFQPSQPRFFPRVWNYVMNNASQPAELEKEWAVIEAAMESKYPKSTPKEREQHRKGLEALLESKSPLKATVPASSVAEPNDWQTIPATEYDAQGKAVASPRSPGTGKQDFYPDTGKPIQAPASQHKSAPPSGR